MFYLSKRLDSTRKSVRNVKYNWKTFGEVIRNRTDENFDKLSRLTLFRMEKSTVDNLRHSKNISGNDDDVLMKSKIFLNFVHRNLPNTSKHLIRFFSLFMKNIEFGNIFLRSSSIRFYVKYKVCNFK